MAVKGKEVKGKQVAGKGSSGKRKRDDTAKSGGRKRKNPGVLQFFDVAAEVEDDEDKSEDDWFDDDDSLDKIDAELKDKNEPGKSHHLPFIPKEEELSDEEIAELLEERYRPGSRHVFYAEDNYEAKSSLAGNGLMPSKEDPIVWRVKCMVGRERYSVFCLMQKYVDMQSLGTKLQTISAFALDHAKGCIFVEAYREFDLIEACKGLCSIYSTTLKSVPRNEVSHLLITRNKTNDVSVGSWARMKYGIYKGDLTQVVAVNAARKRTTVKLIPRIDLQAIAKKLSGEGTVKRTSVPAPRLISSSELEDFRKHIQYKHDPDTGMYFQKIDGLMLKDGYLYKRVSIDSLCCWDVVPSADELQRFEASSKEHQSDDTEWLLGLYGEGRSKCSEKCDNRKTDVSKGASVTLHGSGFELHDLVFFSENDVGVIIGMEESDRFQILKDSEGEVETVTVELDELRRGSEDRKFTPKDHHMETISINDAIRVLEGPFMDRQGIIKQMYKGTLFIYDENQLESSGYFCAKSQFCEKLKHSKHDSQENIDDGPGPPGFQDSMASPESPPSSPKSSPLKKPWEARGNFRDSNSNFQGDRDGMFSIGQTVRIKVGPLKGYLCRVIAIYRSNVTVKLDCQLKIISVKCEHLSEVRVKTCGESFRDPASNAEIGNQGWAGDLTDGKGAFGESNGWNSSGLSTGRNSWPDLSASGFSTESPFANPFQSTASDPKRDEGDDAWGSKLSSAAGNKTTNSWETAIGSREDDNSAWGKITTKNKAMDATNDKVGNWGGSADCWDKATAKDGFGSINSDGWGKAKFPTEGKAGCSRDAGDSWDTAKLCQSSDATDSWNKTKNAREIEEVLLKKSDDIWHKGEVGRENHTRGWDSDSLNQNRPNSCDNRKQDDGNEGSWVSTLDSQGKSNTVNANQEDSWGKAADTWKGKSVTTASMTDGNSAAAAGGWGSARKKPDDLWNKREVGSENNGSGWNSNAIGQDRQNSWDKGKQIVGNDGSALDSEAKLKTDNSNQEESWERATDSWKREGGMAGSKTGWNSATAAGGWDSAAGSSLAKGDQGSSWNKDKGWSASQSEKWSGTKENREGEPLGWKKSDDLGHKGGVGRENLGSGWNSDATRHNRPNSWDNEKRINVNDGSALHFQGNKSKTDNENQEESWEKATDTRKGKGGTTGSRTDWKSATAAGGWGNAAGSFMPKGDQGSSSWNKDKGWSASQSGERSNTKENHEVEPMGWRKSGDPWDKVEHGNGKDSWGKASDTWKAKDGSSGSQADCWNSATAGGGWNACQTENSATKGGWNRPSATGANETLTWSDGGATENKTDGRKEDQNGCWSKPKSFGGDLGFDCNKERVENKDGWGNGDQEDSWDKRKTFDGGRGFGGRRGRGGNRGGGRGNFGRGRSYGSNDEGSKWNMSTVSGGSQSRWNNGSNGSEGGVGDGWNKSNVSSEDQHMGWKSESSDKGGNQASGWDRGSNWNIPKSSNENQSSGWQRGDSDAGGNQFGWGKSSWSQGSGANESDGHRDQGRSSGPTRGGFEYRGRGSRGRGNQSGGWGRGRGSGEDGSFGRNSNTNDGEGGWGSSNRADSWNQGGGFGNRGRGRRDQYGGRGRGRASGREGSFNWNQNNGDGQGDRASSGNQGSDAGKGQWQGWSVGRSGPRRDGGGSSEAGGVSSLGKGKEENPWGSASGSWGASSFSNRKDENPGGDAAGILGASPFGKGKDENTWGNASGSWGASSLGNQKDENPGGGAAGILGATPLGKGKDEDTWGNAAGSWGASSSGKEKENQWSNAAGSWGKGSNDGGAKSGW